MSARRIKRTTSIITVSRVQRRSRLIPSSASPSQRLQSRVFFPILLALGFFFFLPSVASALTVEAVSPTPNALHLYRTKLLFEAAITEGASDGNSYRIDWDFTNDGSNDVPPRTITVSAGTKARYIDNPSAYGDLRMVLNPNDAVPVYPYTANNTYTFRLTVTELGSGMSATATGTFSLYDALAFTGYTWFGASTGRCVTGSTVHDTLCQTDDLCVSQHGAGSTCGGDAPGYASFNCTQQQAGSCAASSYSVLYGRVADSIYPSLQNYGWLGEAEPSGSPPIGWITMNKYSCTAGENVTLGLSCASDAECGAVGGACTPLDDFATALPTGVDGEDWSANASDVAEMNRVYQAPETGLTPARFPGQLAGWGRITSLADYGLSALNQKDWGWIHLRGSEAPKPNGDPPFYSTVSADAFKQCLDCSASGTKCNACQRVQTQITDTDESSWKRYACNSCYDCDPDAGTCDRCEACNEYGVSFDTQFGRLVGYAWAGNESEIPNSKTSGLGWVQFNPVGGITILQGWLSTRYGDIFGGGDIQSTGIPPANTYNATYIIQAYGTIASTFTSQNQSTAGFVRSGYPAQIPLPAAPTGYINVLGRINFSELVIGTGQSSPKQHRYGRTVTLSADPEAGWNAAPLGGDVYYRDGDLTLDADVTFPNGDIGADGIGEAGSATIIVDGDLTINADLEYEDPTSDLENILDIPSLAWVVRGDVHIDPSVAHVVGAFIVLGCPGDTDNDGSPDEPCGDAKDGVLNTGESQTTVLTAKGLMMARRFAFERDVVSQAGAEGSEQIIYDGRFIANPPPGLQDLTAALPDIRLETPR